MGRATTSRKNIDYGQSTDSQYPSLPLDDSQTLPERLSVHRPFVQISGKLDCQTLDIPTPTSHLRPGNELRGGYVSPRPSRTEANGIQRNETGSSIPKFFEKKKLSLDYSIPFPSCFDRVRFRPMIKRRRERERGRERGRERERYDGGKSKAAKWRSAKTRCHGGHGSLLKRMYRGDLAWTTTDDDCTPAYARDTRARAHTRTDTRTKFRTYVRAVHSPGGRNH